MVPLVWLGMRLGYGYERQNGFHVICVSARLSGRAGAKWRGWQFLSAANRSSFLFTNIGSVRRKYTRLHLPPATIVVRCTLTVTLLQVGLNIVFGIISL